MAKSNAERQAEYRERKRRELEAEGLPARDIDEQPDTPAVSDAEPDERSIEALLALGTDAELTAEEEQALRDHFGFTASERRSRVERAAAAETMRRGAPDLTNSPSLTEALSSLQVNEERHSIRTQDYRASLRRD
jgi:hypothetical protein